MPMHAHLSLEATEQGKIEGSCDMKGREGTILVEELVHKIYMPHDPQSGMPTGSVVHGPLRLCKYFDRSSPKLYKALARGERFKRVEIKWYRIRPDGKQEHYFSHLLEDAILVGMRPYMPNCLEPDSAPYQHMEDIEFTYRKITWTWQPEGIAAESDWRVPTT